MNDGYSARVTETGEFGFRELVALVRGSEVLTVRREDGLRLPEGTSERGWTEPGDLLKVCGDPTAVQVGPSLRVSTAPSRSVHLLSGSDSSLPGIHWLPIDDLDQLSHADDIRAAVRLAIDQLAGRSARPPLRPDWYRIGWLAEADAWIDRQLQTLGRRRTGPSTMIKIWSLSAVLRTPYESTAGASDEVFFKATNEHFRAEPVISQLLAEELPDRIPPVLAVDAERAWMLMEPLIGAEPQEAEARAAEAAAVLAEVQLRFVPLLDELRAVGCPDRTEQPTIDGLSMIISGSVEGHWLTDDEQQAAKSAESWLREQVKEFYACGIPSTLTHGDLHPDNVAFDPANSATAGGVRLYDWTDACISHPFTDIALLTRRLPDALRGEATNAYAAPWREAFPSADIDRALELAPLMNKVFLAISHEGIARAQEPVAHPYLSGIVARLIRDLSAAATGTSAHR